MARIRTIKPEFWENEEMGKMPYGCRLLFIGMWNFADDQGVIKDNATLLKSKIFPYDENLRVSEVKKWIESLQNAQMLVPIIHNGESYLIICTFAKHQLIDKRYQKFCIPNDIVVNRLKDHTQTTTGSPSDHAVTTPQEVVVEVDMEDIIPPSPNGDVPPLADGGVLVDPDCPPPSEEQVAKLADEEKKKKLREKEKENFLRFQQWITNHAPQVEKLKEPFTQAEFERIKQEFTIEQIQSIITKMHNWKPLLTKRVSANLTFRDWSKKEYNQHHGTTTNGGAITTINPTQSKSERDMEFAQHIARKLAGRTR